jgi:hypothetical protein
LLSLEIYHDTAGSQFMLDPFVLTARQYGEVVLPDAASGNCPGTPRQRGHETVPVQGGYGVVFAVMVQILLRDGAIAVQV